MAQLAIVLSGGGARGAFQAGAMTEVLKYFDRTGRRIHLLAGTSVGALNGMSIAQADSLGAAAAELERQWRELKTADVYRIRGGGLFALFAKFAVTPMDRWTTVQGADSLFDNTPLYRKFVDTYLDLESIRRGRVAEEFFVSLSSLNTGAAYLRSITKETDRRRALEAIMASTITPVAYPPVPMVLDDPLHPADQRGATEMCADGGISNKTPLKAVLRAGRVEELFVVNTYPSYPTRTAQSIRARFPNLFALLVRTAVELLPNLYFQRDMETLRDVNEDIRTWRELRDRLRAAGAGDAELDAVLAEAERRFSFTRGGKHIIEPVVIAPDEELAVQDTQFVQPQMRDAFAQGVEKAKAVLERRGM